MGSTRDREIEKNYVFFTDFVGSLMARHKGEFALLHSGEFIHSYATVGQAIAAGHSKYGDGMFSIQEVTDRPLDLGFISHARIEGGLRTEATDS